MKNFCTLLLVISYFQSEVHVEMNREYASNDQIMRIMLCADSSFVYSKGKTGLSYGSWKIGADSVSYVLNSSWKMPRDINQINANFDFFENVRLKVLDGKTIAISFDESSWVRFNMQDSVSQKLTIIRAECSK